MNLVIETLFLRRPKLDYLSPAICEAIFSSTGSPTIILNEIGKHPGPTGLVMGGTGRRRFSWNAYPGALCYNVYTAVIEPTTITECEALVAASLTITYQLLFECHVEPFVIVPHAGCYRVSAITPDGESDLSDPLCTCDFPSPTVEVCNQEQTATCTPPQTGAPVTTPAGVFCVEVPADPDAIAEAQAQMNTLALDEATAELICSGGPSCPGPVWNDIVWDEVTADPGTNGSASATASANSFAVSVSSPTDLGSGSAFVTLHGTVGYTGPSVTCRVRLTITGQSGFAVTQPLAFYVGATHLWNWLGNSPMNDGGWPITITNPASDVYDLEFVLPVCVGETLTISGVFGTLILLGSPNSQGSFAYNAVFSNKC